MNGIIIKSLSGNYYVKTDSTTILCKARGIFRKNKISPLPGDTVKISLTGDDGVIDEILPRKNALIRPPIANIDIMFIVVATADPDPSLNVTDKLIAVCEENDIRPIIVINKTDIKSPKELEDIYNKAEIETLTVCAHSGEGCEKIKELIGSNICAFGGNSGVGKSSILKALGICDDAEIGEISKISRGKHTTKRVELFEAFGGYIADTPGFGDISYEECLRATKTEVASLFREFSKYEGCRFDDCAHINEPDCAIKTAVENGEIALSRYESYKEIYEESLKRKNY